MLLFQSIAETKWAVREYLVDNFIKFIGMYNMYIEQHFNNKYNHDCLGTKYYIFLMICSLMLCGCMLKQFNLVKQTVFQV